METKIKGRVLIIDDEQKEIIALTQILSPIHTVYAAMNGPDGIEMAEKHMPDVILLDIRMPDMDGYEVFSTLKSSSKTKNIPIVFIADISTDDEEKALSLGAADFITKPFSRIIAMMRVSNQVEMREHIRTIERMAVIDQLTGIPNRRSFNDRLNIEWGRAQREQQPISILMIDLDSFSSFNDAHGYEQGDFALQRFVRTFPAVLKRRSDYAARWDGEEFVTLLTNTPSAGAQNVAEMIRKYVEELEIPGPDGLLSKITVSIGINTWTREDDYMIDDFIARAGAALQTAKKTGKNRVCLY